MLSSVGESNGTGPNRQFVTDYPQTLSSHPETFSEADRQLYAKAYAQEGAMRAAFEMFKSLNSQDATDMRKFADTRLTMPALTIEGDRRWVVLSKSRLKLSPITSLQSYSQTPDIG